jgi:putative transcriptional regulator
MIRHHPDDALLLAHAGGGLATGPALLLEAHLESCARCRQVVQDFERVGGRLLAGASAQPLAPGALESLLGRLDGCVSLPSPPLVRPKPPLPAGCNWPRALRHCQASGWRPMGPGMRWSRVTVPHDPHANVLLLRIGAGKCLPRHTHTGTELTQVLHGAFDDGRAVFATGDFDEADGDVRHQPVVQAQGECICLAAVDGRLVFESWIARLASSVAGL